MSGVFRSDREPGSYHGNRRIPKLAVGNHDSRLPTGGAGLYSDGMSDAVIRPPTLAELRAKRTEILRVAAAYRVTNVRVFGSVARGDADARDVDFVVDLPNDARGFHAFGVLDELRQDLEAPLACTVDVITIRGAFSAQGAAMAQRIEQEALTL